MFVLTEPIGQRPAGGPLGAEHGAERAHLDRIAERGAGAVRLDVADTCAASTPRRGQRLADHRLLRRAVGDGQPAAPPVLVDGRAADHGEDAVAVGQRVAQPLEDDHAAALAAHVAVGGGVERLAAAVRRQHAAPGRS